MNKHLHEESILTRRIVNGRAQLTTAIEELDNLQSDNFSVPGCLGNVRFKEADRTKISDYADQVVQSFERSGGCKGSILHAPSGIGKTSLVKGIVAAHDGIGFIPLNLGDPAFRSGLKVLKEHSVEPAIVLIDEVDSRKTDKWPYEELLALFQTPAPERAYVLAGSTPGGLNGMIAEMTRRKKGPDVVNRILGRFEVPPWCLGDRALVFAAAVTAAACGRSNPISLIEKFAILYTLTREDLANGHRIGDFAAAAVSRMCTTESRLRFTHLFDSADERQMFTFLARNQTAVNRCTGRWIRI